MTTETQYWHFIANGRLRDGSAPAAPGETERWDGPVVLCKSGLHASRRALDALEYVPIGSTVQVRLVTLSGTVVHGDDKSAASERPIVASADCTRVLHEFALWCVEPIRHLSTDEHCIHALETKRLWLDGKATDFELTTARNAAWKTAMHPADCTAAHTANDTPRSAAWVAAAARDVTRVATGDIAKIAVRDATWGTIWATIKDAARDAVWAAQNAELERRLRAILA